MNGISSYSNDHYIGEQIRGLQRPHQAFKHISSLLQLDGVVPLRRAQLYSFVDNYLRMHLFYYDNNEWSRQRKAVAFEEKVGRWLDSIQAQYVPEKQLRQVNRSRQQAGLPAIPTPDFLLQAPIKMDNFLVHWVECKNYYGIATPEAVKKLGFLKSAQKYHKRYGTGIVVFHYGFNKDLDVPKGVLLKSFKDLKLTNLKL